MAPRGVISHVRREENRLFGFPHEKDFLQRTLKEGQSLYKEACSIRPSLASQPLLVLVEKILR
jgi:hypothetical protein